MAKFESEITKDAKTNLKKENKVKKLKNNQTIKTIITVIITLTLVGALGGMFWAGMNYESSKNVAIKAEAQKLVNELKLDESQ